MAFSTETQGQKRQQPTEDIHIKGLRPGYPARSPRQRSASAWNPSAGPLVCWDTEWGKSPVPHPEISCIDAAQGSERRTRTHTGECLSLRLVSAAQSPAGGGGGGGGKYSHSGRLPTSNSARDVEVGVRSTSREPFPTGTLLVPVTWLLNDNRKVRYS